MLERKSKSGDATTTKRGRTAHCLDRRQPSTQTAAEDWHNRWTETGGRSQRRSCAAIAAKRSEKSLPSFDEPLSTASITLSRSDNDWQVMDTAPAAEFPYPSSFSRHSVPTWYSIALYHRQRAEPAPGSSASPASSLGAIGRIRSLVLHRLPTT